MAESEFTLVGRRQRGRKHGRRIATGVSDASSPELTRLQRQLLSSSVLHSTNIDDRSLGIYHTLHCLFHLIQQRAASLLARFSSSSLFALLSARMLRNRAIYA